MKIRERYKMMFVELNVVSELKTEIKCFEFCVLSFEFEL